MPLQKEKQRYCCKKGPTKTNFVYIKNFVTLENERRWNRDSNFGNWL